jgi:hypothetical protein
VSELRVKAILHRHEIHIFLLTLGWKLITGRFLIWVL